MTVSSTTARVDYAGNGVTTLFSVPFPFIQNDYLQVLRINASTLISTTLVLDSVGANGYTVSGAGNPTGSVTVVTAPTASERLAIVRVVPATQEADFVANDPFPAETFENALDKLTMVVGQAVSDVGRALKLFEGDLDGSGRYDANSNRIVALADGVASNDAATVGQLIGAGSGNFIASGTGSVTRTMQNKVRESVSVVDYGAVGDGATDDTTAFINALATGKAVFVPATATSYRVDEVIIPSGAVLYGEGSGSKITPFTINSADVLTLDNSATDIEIYDLTFEIDPATYPVKQGIGGNGNERVTLRDLHFIGGGAYAIAIAGQTQTIVQRVRVDGVGQSGILLFTADQCLVSDCIVRMESGLLAGIEIYNGLLSKISGCNVEKAGVFGLHFVNSQFCTMVNNTTWNTDREGINLEDSSNCLVANNLVAWDGSQSLDFGISVFAQTISSSYNSIIDNVVLRPFKSGICIDGSLFNAVGSQVSGNRIYGCNIENDAAGAGILLFGANVVNTHVSDNLIDGTIGSLKYGINAGGASTLSSIVGNRVIGAATAVVARDNGTVANNVAPPVAWVPVVTPGAGAITSYTVNNAKYQENEKMVFISVDITITNNGTGATNILITLPFTASTNAASIAGRETAVGGFMLSGHIVASSVSINVEKVDGTYPGGTGNRLVLSGWYERV